jgi:2-phosphosulfolactate phosphatase
MIFLGLARLTPSGQVSLSPVAIRRSSGIERLVLPSPNRFVIAQNLAATGSRVIGVSTQRRCRSGLDGGPTSRCPGDCRRGHRRPANDGPTARYGPRWRTCGGGCVPRRLADRGIGPLSPEAQAATAVYRHAVDRGPPQADLVPGGGHRPFQRERPLLLNVGSRCCVCRGASSWPPLAE